MSNHAERFNKADILLNENKIEDALAIYLDLQKVDMFSAFCFYRIACISNMTGDPETAYDLYYKTLERLPTIASNILPKEHSSFNYIFHGKKTEVRNENCPLCGEDSTPRWCYPLMEAQGYNSFFNPIRMWMYCQPCHHMFARDFPEKLFIHNASPRVAVPSSFTYYSQILSKIRMGGYAVGMSLFEVGIGACECLLAAREIGYETFGIDVIERHVEDAKKKYGLNAETADFIEFDSDQKWDVIIMGDVLEHVSDPIQAIAKAESLLKDDGALWISTPSFESAHAMVVGHNDIMRRQQYHINYFSRESLYSILEQNNLVPVDYHVSGHYSGSMEVTIIKASRL